MEHMPEAFVPVQMLYIRMKINNHPGFFINVIFILPLSTPVIAFIDSGTKSSKGLIINTLISF